MAIRFNADGEQYTRSANLPGITAFTLMGWFRITDRNAYSTFFSYGANGSSCYTIQTNATGTALVLWDGLSEVGLGLSVTAATYAHVAVTVSGTSGSNFLGYVNGTVGTAHVARSITGSSLLVGESHGGAEWLNAACADLKFFSAVLTAAEIRAEMWQYVPARFTNVNGFYPLLSLTDDEVDYSGNGFNLTPAGTLTVEDGPPIPWRRSQKRQAPYAVSGGGSFSLTADPGVYVVTGADAALRTARVLVAAPGSYLITGVAASLLAHRVLQANPGSYLVTGAPASLLTARVLQADPGAYLISGADATLETGQQFELIAEPGGYQVTGFNAGLLAHRVLRADPGSYLITGAPATLVVPPTPGVGGDARMQVGDGRQGTSDGMSFGSTWG